MRIALASLLALSVSMPASAACVWTGSVRDYVRCIKDETVALWDETAAIWAAVGDQSVRVDGAENRLDDAESRLDAAAPMTPIALAVVNENAYFESNRGFGRVTWDAVSSVYVLERSGGQFSGDHVVAVTPHGSCGGDSPTYSLFGWNLNVWFEDSDTLTMHECGFSVVVYEI